MVSVTHAVSLFHFVGEQYCSKLSNILFENRYGFEDELAQSLEKLNLRIEHSPQKVKAKGEFFSIFQFHSYRFSGKFLIFSCLVLKTPSIFFEGASPIRDIKDGSWNLRYVFVIFFEHLEVAAPVESYSRLSDALI